MSRKSKERLLEEMQPLAESVAQALSEKKTDAGWIVHLTEKLHNLALDLEEAMRR